MDATIVGMESVSKKVTTGSSYVYRVAKPLQRGQDGYWSVQARNARQLFPSDIIVVHKGTKNSLCERCVSFFCSSSSLTSRGEKEGNTVDKNGKLTLKTDPHLGKRDIIE